MANKLLQGAGPLPDAQVESLCLRHLELVLQANENLNLTSLKTIEQGQVLHIEDSLAGLPEVLDAVDGPLADLGSGAGYPGIPIACASGRTTTLIESTGKKAAALENIISALGLVEQVQVCCERAEDVARQQPGAFAVVTARAVAPLVSLAELASPLLMQKGVLIAYKSDDVDEEIVHACAVQDKLGMELLSQRSFVLSDGTTRRRIVVFEKCAEPSVSLPRRSGMAQKRPYRA